tara:strand:- start:672 stop:1733 length:1062 start_codon:yes stop_codon:yes gene_type:complete
MKRIKIGKKFIGDNCPFYTIAEIGSNFDNSLKKAYKLVDLAIEAGADAVKFQSFKAENLVSDVGFKKLKIGYQSKWKKSVTQVYKEAEFPRNWHKKVFNYCKKKKIDFFSAPYDKQAVDDLNKLGVPAFKIGSGDITWLENIKYIASKKKPIILATGASKMSEIRAAIETIRKTGNKKIVLLQCVTNYPASFKNVNLKVLSLFKKEFNCLVGYSDHTPGSSVAIGSVALGGCMIEKHFTDNKKLPGPDHSFAMDKNDFKKMVNDIRHMERIMGKGKKRIYPEEENQYISMKRSIRAKYNLNSGTTIRRKDLVVLRPCEKNSLSANYLEDIIGKTLLKDVKKGISLKRKDIKFN